MAMDQKRPLSQSLHKKINEIHLSLVVDFCCNYPHIICLNPVLNSELKNEHVTNQMQHFRNNRYGFKWGHSGMERLPAAKKQCRYCI